MTSYGLEVVMAKQNPSREVAPKRNIPKNREPLVFDPCGDRTLLQPQFLPRISPRLNPDQSWRLGDVRFSSAQRQSLAAQIEKVQGNQYLHRTLETLKPWAGATPPRIQRTLAEFDRKRQEMGIAPGHSVEPLPPSVEDRREGALYYDHADQQLEAMCKSDTAAERLNLQGFGSYIIGYSYYKIYFIFGRGALLRRQSGGQVEVPGESLLAMYRHEREHQRQYQATRQVDRQIASHNQALSRRIGRFTSPETISQLASQMIPIDPEIWSQQSRAEHSTPARAERTSGMEETGCMDLTSRANREVSAHTVTFSQMVSRSVSAALEQIQPLSAVVSQVGTTPSWSYDMADAGVKNEAISRVLGSIWRTRQPVVILNDHVIPALEIVEASESRRGRTPTTFLTELRAACRQNQSGLLEPNDPEISLRYLQGSSFR